jgi:hypothetical protein
MGPKELRKADLAPDQFFFQAAGEELTALVGQHGATFDWLLSSLNDDLGVVTGTAIAVAPAFVLDANVFDFGGGETLAPTQRADAAEEDALISLNPQFRFAGKAA